MSSTEFDMARSSDDAGTIQTLLDRLNKQRLPRMLAIKKKVDGGGALDDADLAYLKDILDDARGNERLFAKHPEYQALVARVIGLYDEITRKALDNETAGKSQR
jgi:hypothetical protein